MTDLTPSLSKEEENVVGFDAVAHGERLGIGSLVVIQILPLRMQLKRKVVCTGHQMKQYPPLLALDQIPLLPPKTLMAVQIKATPKL